MHLEELRGAAAQRLSTNLTVVSLTFTRGNYIFNICSLPRCGNKSKLDVEFSHSTRNISKIGRKVGNGVP